MENRSGDSRSCAYESIPAAIIIINKHGVVTSYSRQYVDPYTNQ